MTFNNSGKLEIKDLIFVNNFMKITAEQYAKLLYEAFSSPDKKEQNSLIKGIAKLIKKSRKNSILGNIENRYLAIKKKKSGHLEGIVYSVKKMEIDQLKDLKKAISVKKDIPEKSIELENRVDPRLIGGFIVKFENEIFDGSLVSKIARVKKALIE